MNNDAIQELEVKIAFLEDALNKLSDEHYAQQKEIDKLKLSYEILSEKINSSGGEGAVQGSLQDEVPPHY